MREWLRKARKERKLTQEQVAEKLEMSGQLYSLIENEQRQKRLPLSTAMKLSKLFRIPITQILEMEEADEHAGTVHTAR